MLPFGINLILSGLFVLLGVGLSFRQTHQVVKRLMIALGVLWGASFLLQAIGQAISIPVLVRIGGIVWIVGYLLLLYGLWVQSRLKARKQ